MIPHLDLWGLRLPTHEVFMVLGLVVAGAVLVRTAGRSGRWDGDFQWLVVGALIGAAVFAKLGTAWRYLAEAEDPSVVGVWLYGGKALLGGLAGAYLGVLVAKRLIGYERSSGDLFAPGVALGIAVGRIGCLLTEQPGTPTTMPWGITVSAEAAARIPNCPQCALGVPLHPSFAYEIVFLLALAGFLMWLRPRVTVEGDVFKVFLIAYGVFRFFIEFIRGNEALLWGLSGSQVFLVLVSPLSVIWVVRRVGFERNRRREAALGRAT